MLISTAVRFIRFRLWRFIICLVAGVKGTCRLTKSAWLKRFSRSVNLSPNSRSAASFLPISQYSTSMSKPLARRATARPMRPRPTRPSVAPQISCPKRSLGPHVFQCPRLTKSALSTMRRATAINKVKAKSAVVSVSTPGVLVIMMPRAVAARRSKLSYPTA